MFVSVKIESLNAFSKLISSNNKMLDKINKLIKNEINIRKVILIVSDSIFLSDKNMFLFKTLKGLTSLSISKKVDFNKMYILINLIPEVADITDPPIIVKEIK